jgi:hypothetical protein
MRYHHGAQSSRPDSEWKTLDVAHRVVRARAGSDTPAFVPKDWVVVLELEVLLLQLRRSVYGTRHPRLLQKHC